MFKYNIFTEKEIVNKLKKANINEQMTDVKAASKAGIHESFSKEAEDFQSFFANLVDYAKKYGAEILKKYPRNLLLVFSGWKDKFPIEVLLNKVCPELLKYKDILNYDFELYDETLDEDDLDEMPVLQWIYVKAKKKKKADDSMIKKICALPKGILNTTNVRGETIFDVMDRKKDFRYKKYINKVTASTNLNKYYYKGQIITASSKKEAIHKIIASNVTANNKNVLTNEIKEKIKRLERSGANKVSAEIKFKDNGSVENVTIALSDDADDEAFYHCSSISDLISLFDKENQEDFVVKDIYP